MPSSGRKDKGDIGIGTAEEPQSINDIVTAIQTNLLPGPSGTGTSVTLLREETASGVNSTLAFGLPQEWYQRPLNTITTDPDSLIVTGPDANGTFRLTSGTYRFTASAYHAAAGVPAQRLDTRLAVEILDTSGTQLEVIIGDTAWVQAAGGNDGHWPYITGRFTLSAESDVKLHHWVEPTNSSEFGTAGVSPPFPSGGSDSLSLPALQNEVWSWFQLHREGGPVTVTTEITGDLDPDEPEKAFKVRTPLPDVIINPIQRQTLETHIIGEDIIVGQRDWTGINKRTAPHELGIFEAEDAQNVDSIGHPGSVQPRRGMVRMQLKAAAHTNGGLAVQDLGLVDSAGSAHMLIAGLSVVPEETHETFKQDVIIPPAIKPDFAPAVTLGTSGTAITVTISAITAYSGVEAVLVRWHETNFPVSVHPLKEKLSQNGTTIPWTGEIGLVGTTDSVSPLSGTLFVTVWIKTALGYSEPFHGKVTGIPLGAFDSGFDSGMS